jgi:hypothetical protein
MAATRAKYEVKASTFRAYLVQLQKLGVLEAVRAKVPDETREAIDQPPLPGAWSDGMFIEDIICALESLRGMDAVRKVTKGGQQEAILPILRPIITGLLRLFGASPETLLSRWPDFTRTNVRGIDFKWVRESDRAGRLVVTFPRKQVPRSAYAGMESGCSLILDLCGVKGTIMPADLSHDGSIGSIRVSW